MLIVKEVGRGEIRKREGVVKCFERWGRCEEKCSRRKFWQIWDWAAVCSHRAKNGPNFIKFSMSEIEYVVRTVVYATKPIWEAYMRGVRLLVMAECVTWYCSGFFHKSSSPRVRGSGTFCLVRESQDLQPIFWDCGEDRFGTWRWCALGAPAWEREAWISSLKWPAIIIFRKRPLKTHGSVIRMANRCGMGICANIILMSEAR